MNKSNKFSPEVRERAVRMVQEHRGEYPSLWAAIESIAPQRGMASIRRRGDLLLRLGEKRAGQSTAPTRCGGNWHAKM